MPYRRRKAEGHSSRSGLAYKTELFRHQYSGGHLGHRLFDTGTGGSFTGKRCRTVFDEDPLTILALIRGVYFAKACAFFIAWIAARVSFVGA